MPITSYAKTWYMHRDIDIATAGKESCWKLSVWTAEWWPECGCGILTKVQERAGSISWQNLFLCAVGSYSLGDSTYKLINKKKKVCCLFVCFWFRKHTLTYQKLLVSYIFIVVRQCHIIPAIEKGLIDSLSSHAVLLKKKKKKQQRKQNDWTT